MPNEAQAVNYLFQIDLKGFIVSLIVVVAVCVTIYQLIRKVQEITGIETKSMRNKRLVDEAIKDIRKEVDSLKQSQDKDDAKMDKIMKCMDDLSSTIAQNNIESKRWAILDFANAAQSGRQFTSEAYIHIIEVYDEYERLLKENNMENGRVTMAIQFIKERYEVGVRDGFPV